ncbi:ABC transporter substrate-binding protein [Pseudoalteromonas sp. NEC-BIFX-2020_015]|uniref:heme/hemin ABC transporter substrate-binding protein n=1 Tax=Pseudoalteromonas sp. NEC-BIFX-2020_015 TaxID=2729544 RepID=UPI00146136A7|nr:ABC transporter substrate-binding protein [Pseudoalteromonas sp. NEC-BIFX-2020_015]NMR26175.1 ABC transporter substrate-binding protein [Pseudoalteromonas sp. NEC-BIFX-2020_015]
MKPLLTYLIFMIFATAFPLSAATQPDSPQRVVVSGGSITEIIYALQEQQRIIGVDSTSVFPASATQKPQIGYVRRISAEGILSLNPDLVLGESDTGPKKVVEQLKKTGVNLVILNEHDNFLGIEKKIKNIAQLLNVPAKGDVLVQSLQADRNALAHILKQAKTKPNVLFVLSVRSGQPIVAGAGTSANELITAAGGVNAAASAITNWKPLSTEAALAINPDIIITMGRHGDDPLPKIEKLAHFKYTNAVKNGQVHSFDGSYLLGMGPRTPQAVVELAHTFHPKTRLPSGYNYQFLQTAQSTTDKATNKTSDL